MILGKKECDAAGKIMEYQNGESGPDSDEHYSPNYRDKKTEQRDHNEGEADSGSHDAHDEVNEHIPKETFGVHKDVRLFFLQPFER
jgi:hypothetical protein